MLSARGPLPRWPGPPQQQLKRSPAEQQLMGRLHSGRPSHTTPSCTPNAPEAVSTALQLAGRSTAAVLWDLDNVCPGSSQGGPLPAIQEVKDLLTALQLPQPPSITCYANTNTAKSLGNSVVQQLLQAGVQLQQVQARQQAADVRLSSDAYAFAQAHKHAGCLVVVSNDTGYASVLAYCTSLGVATILVTNLRSPKYLPGHLPDARRHSLASSCTAAVPWHTSSAPTTPRSPLGSSAYCWHSLSQLGLPSEGSLEPWVFISPPGS